MIKRFLRWLWCPGPCKWKIIREVKLVEQPTDDVGLGHKYVLQCETCGTIRAKVT